jgi:Arc/MetJ-type ribon-helix-helix transcriptional regulator
MKGTVVSVRLSDALVEGIDEVMRSGSLGSRSDAVRHVLEEALAARARGRAQGPLIEALEERLSEMEDRLVRTGAKGTKAALAALVGVSALLPAAAGLASAGYGLASKAWRAQGMDVADRAAAKDQAALAGWQGCSASQFFGFCWQAGGKAASSGQAMEYGSLVKGIRPKESGDPLPDSGQAHGAGDECAPFLVEAYGKAFAEEWERQRALKAERDSLYAQGAAIPPAEREMHMRDAARYDEMKRMVAELTGKQSHKAAGSLATDIAGTGTWRPWREADGAAKGAGHDEGRL